MEEETRTQIVKEEQISVTEEVTRNLGIIQQERDKDFAEIIKELQKRYHEKNILYGDSFMIANENIDEAFNEIKPVLEVLNITLKHRERLFNKEKYIKKLKDLAIIAVENIMWVENNIR